MEKCPECNGNTITTKKEVYCKDCGYVLESFPIDDSVDNKYDGNGNIIPVSTTTYLQPEVGSVIDVADIKKICKRR